jgi:hypothetical protein
LPLAIGFSQSGGLSKAALNINKISVSFCIFSFFDRRGMDKKPNASVLLW